MSTNTDGQQRRLGEWFAGCLGVDHVEIEEFDGVATGHSAQTLLVTIAWTGADGPRRRDVVVRVRPEPPGLLEPCEMGRQFDILRALEPTPVRAPAVLWREPTGEVLGQEFFVMERLPGTVYEREIPEELVADPARVRAMSESLADELVAIHRVDVTGPEFAFLGDGRDFLDEQIEYWGGEMRRVQRGPLPVLERLLAELVTRKPAPSPVVTLVHGDPKPGNFAFVGNEVSADFDWELTTVGDPMADVGYAEVTWLLPGMFTTLPASLTPDDLVARYERQTGIEVHDRAWHRSFQRYKIAVIMLLGSMLFDSGATDDPRMGFMGHGVPIFTDPAMAELGIDDVTDQGAVLPRDERLVTLGIS
jgi:aminoglycoside phosphotransferase (APT) family kinase protein